MKVSRSAYAFVVALLLTLAGAITVEAAGNDTSSKVMLDGGKYVPMWRGRLDTVYGFSYFTPAYVLFSFPGSFDFTFPPHEWGEGCTWKPDRAAAPAQHRYSRLAKFLSAAGSRALQARRTARTAALTSSSASLARSSLVQNSCQTKKGQQCSLIPGESYPYQSFVLDPLSDNPSQVRWLVSVLLAFGQLPPLSPFCPPSLTLPASLRYRSHLSSRCSK